MSQEQQTADNEEPLSAYESGRAGAGIDWTDPTLPVAPLYMTSGGVIGVALLSVFFLYLCVVPLWHTDFWAHLKYGEWIVANRTLPDQEPLSPFTDKQTPMFDAMWLTQVGYYGLFRAGETIAGGDAQRQLEGGVELIRLTHVLVSLQTVIFLALAYRRISDSVPWAILGVFILLVLMLAPLTVQRPQSFALACNAAILWGISRPVLSRAALLWIPLVVVLWANLHGSFIVGIGVMGVVFLGRAMELCRANNWSLAIVRSDPAVRRLFAVIVLSIMAAGLINPYGPRYYVLIATFGNHPNLATFDEWQPLNFRQLRGGAGLYLFTLGLLVVTPLLSRQFYTPTQLLFILTLGLWPIVQQRAMIWWAPMVPWIIGPHWVVAATRWNLRATDNVPSFRKTALAALLVVVTISVSPALSWAKMRRPHSVAEALHPGTPYDVAAVLKGQQPANSERVAELAKVIQTELNGQLTGRVFASETQGEYLLWALPAESPVMLFNHIQLFTPAYWTECQKLKFAQPGWSEVLEQFQPTVIVVEVDRHPRLCAELRQRPDWIVAVDETTKPATDNFTRLFVAVRKTRLAKTPRE
jgi:hypothetical protein